MANRKKPIDQIRFTAIHRQSIKKIMKALYFRHRKERDVPNLISP